MAYIIISKNIETLENGDKLKFEVIDFDLQNEDSHEPEQESPSDANVS